MKNAFKLFGVIALVAIIGFSMAACEVDEGSDGSDVPPENKPVTDHWWKWVADDATATLVYSVDNDGVCKITVGGTAQPNNETDGWGRWKASTRYSYTAKPGTSYVYTFEAWTESGTREFGFQYNEDNDNSIYYSQEISLTTASETFTVYGQPLLKNAANQVSFQCADQLGTFYVKMLEIEEYINMDVPNIAEMDRWLKAQPANTAATAYTYKLNVNNLGGDVSTSGSAGAVLMANNTKYVKLDLSGSTITYIQGSAFSDLDWEDGRWVGEGCKTLVGITLPKSVTIALNDSSAKV